MSRVLVLVLFGFFSVGCGVGMNLPAEVTTDYGRVSCQSVWITITEVLCSQDKDAARMHIRIPKRLIKRMIIGENEAE